MGFDEGEQHFDLLGKVAQHVALRLWEIWGTPTQTYDGFRCCEIVGVEDVHKNGTILDAVGKLLFNLALLPHLLHLLADRRRVQKGLAVAAH